MFDYPHYSKRMIEKAGRPLHREVVGPHETRAYFPDNDGRLRLIAINNETTNEQLILTDGALQREFGVCREDLFGVDCAEYSPLQNLDDLCTWPRKLYPDRYPRAGATGPMPDLPPIAGKDAWI